MRSGNSRSSDAVPIPEKRRRTGHEINQVGPVLKSNNDIWLVGHPIENICTSTLPSRRQAYLRFRYIKQHDTNSTAAAKKYREQDPKLQKLTYDKIVAQKVMDEIEPFWRKGGYIMKDPYLCREEIIKIHNDWQYLSKSSKDTNVGPKRLEARQKFSDSLDCVLNLNPPDWEQLLHKTRSKETVADDIMFMKNLLANVKTGGMAGKDLVHKKMIDRKMKRSEEEEKRRRIAAEEKENFDNRITTDDPFPSGETAVEDESCYDPDFITLDRSTKVRKPDFVTLHLPRNFLQSPLVTITADRTRTSNSHLALITRSLLKLAGANAASVVLSRESIRRYRMANRVTEAQKLKDSFISSTKNDKPCLALHWDEKIMKMATGNKMDQLAVVVTGGVSHKEGKLLAAVPIADGCGATIANKVNSVVDDWELKEFIIGLVFDTTSSNTGIFHGAAIRLEAHFKRKLMWLACRHHIVELLLGAAWEALFGDISSKDNLFFKDFSAKWPTLQRGSPRVLTISDPWLIQEKKNTVLFLQSCVSFVRDDYQEAVQLGLVMLGAIDAETYTWHRPGTFHHARWMSHLLYVPKMLSFADECGYDTDMVEKLSVFVLYTSLFYLPYWLRVNSATDAPMNDLEFPQTNARLPMMIDVPSDYLQDVAESVVEKLKRHTWYLSEELAVLTLFSDSSSSTDKLQVAQKLSTTDHPTEFIIGKPQLPTVAADSAISDFIGPNSWMLFDVMHFDNSWMSENPSTWKENPSYLAAQNILKPLKVVNDPAERAVKLCSDFIDIITHDEDNRASLLQVVEAHRGRVKGRRKLDFFNV